MENNFNQEPTSNMEIFGNSKAEFSKSSLVMEAVRICVHKRGKEMKKGYTTQKLDRFGNIYKEVIPDARKEFMASVDALRGLLSPEARADKEYLKIEKELIENLEKAFQKYGYRPFSYKDKIALNDEFQNKIKKPFIPENTEPEMPEPGSTIQLLDPYGNLQDVEFGWDSKSNSYTDACLNIYDDLFEELNDLISRLGYFKKRQSNE